MRSIKYFVDAISEEIEDAKEYAEKYVECKAKGDMHTANRYKEMSNDELKHAMWLHEMAVAEITEISKVYVAPIAMQEAWDKSHREFTEKTAWIKQMLTM